MSLSERTELLDAHTEGIWIRHDSFFPVIDWAERKLAAGVKELDPAEVTIPRVRAQEALEKAEAYGFKIEPCPVRDSKKKGRVESAVKYLILGLVRRRVPKDWTERYNTASVLCETFVEIPRYTGAGSTTSRDRTSGLGSSEKNGGPPSTGRISRRGQERAPPSTVRPNTYQVLPSSMEGLV